MGKINLSKRHGKIILMGEHSVVYQQPAIALPFKAISTIVNIFETEFKKTIKMEQFTGEIVNLPHEYCGIRTLITEMIQRYHLKNRFFCIEIKTSIPEKRGLGSSAAISVALVESFNKYFDLKLSMVEQLNLVHIAESIHHNNPSGIDTAVIFQDKAIYFEDRTSMHSFDINIPAYLVVADTGIVGDTATAVNTVKKKIYENEKYYSYIESLGTLTEQTYHALKHKNLFEIGQNMYAAQENLEKLGVSHPYIEELISISRKNNALGAKLTGGGLGGCIIALVETREEAIHLQNELKAYEVSDTWYISLKELAK